MSSSRNGAGNNRRKLPHELVVPRRTVLRGAMAGGAMTVALPLLEAMLNDHGDALAGGAEIPRRLLNWMWGNGVRLEYWVPGTYSSECINPGLMQADTGPNYALTEELQPLASVKNDFTLLSGMKNYVAGRRGHHDGMAGLWACHPFIQLDPMGAPYASKMGGPTFDQIVADIVGGDTYYKSLQVGVTKYYEDAQGPTLETMSHRGPDQPLEMERSPQALYDALFMSFTPEDDPDAGLRAKALDTVLVDAQNLKKRVGYNDRIRIDAHLESIFQLQKQILAIPPTCDLPQKPDVDPFNADGTEPLYDLHKAMADLIALAFTCDLTRVATLMFTGPSGGQQFNMLPPSEFPEFSNPQDYSHSDQHQVSHFNACYEQTFIHRSVIHSMENLAYLIELFKNTADGAGTLLDSCAVMASSDVCEGWAHSENDFPIIIAGTAGGRLKSGIGHYRSPNLEPIHEVSLAIAKSVLPNPDDIMELGSNSGSYEGHTTKPSPVIYNG